MPRSACEVVNADGESMLTNLILQTSFAQKHYKQVEGSLIENALVPKRKPKLTPKQYSKWKQWRGNLDYDQLGSPFRLTLRLEAPEQENDKWYLTFLLQSKEDPSYMVDLGEYYSNKQKPIYKKMFGSSIERGLLLQLGYASRLYVPIERLFDYGLYESDIELNKDEAFDFLKEDAWTLHACGYNIIVPSWWTKKGRLKAKIKVNASKRKRDKMDNPKGYLGYESLVDFNYGYAIGNQSISLKEWNELLNAKSDLVFFRGQWITIDPKEMQRMQALIESSEADRLSGNIQDLIEMSANDDDFDVDVDQALEQMVSQLGDKQSITMLDSPEQLQATLRPYQLRGLSWLTYLEAIGMHPCLADDMGLGKTMQIISLLLHRKFEEPSLLIAPTSVIGNWDREIKKFAPSIKTYIYHGSKRKSDVFHKAIEGCDIVITSFGLLRRDKAVFQSQHWSRIIVDEAQNIKNPTAAQTKALCSLEANSRIALEHLLKID